jgi:anti-sigma-K factor RskA
MRHECAVSVEDLGPYLLGQLDAEAALVVEHAVASCASCASEVERLRPVAAALASGVPAVEAAPFRAPEPVLERLLASVTGERMAVRRRRRTRVALAAASVVLLLAGVIGAVVALRGPGDGRQVALHGTTPATGRAVVSERGWGTAIILQVRGLNPGKTYGAWLADAKGQRVPAGTFRPMADGTARLDLGDSLSLDQAATIGVSALGVGDVLEADLPPR